MNRWLFTWKDMSGATRALEVVCSNPVVIQNNLENSGAVFVNYVRLPE